MYKKSANFLENLEELNQKMVYYTGAHAGGKGGTFPPPTGTKKIVVEKWCYFPVLSGKLG